MSSSTTYVCQQCPFGCALQVTVDEAGQMLALEGNTCERGEEYARLRVQGFDDAAIRKITGEGKGVAPNASEDMQNNKPARPARYSAYRKRRK